MVYLGLEPGVAGWKSQTNPLSYGSTPWERILIVLRSIQLKIWHFYCLRLLHSNRYDDGNRKFLFGNYLRRLLNFQIELFFRVWSYH